MVKKVYLNPEKIKEPLTKYVFPSITPYGVEMPHYFVRKLGNDLMATKPQNVYINRLISSDSLEIPKYEYPEIYNLDGRIIGAK